MEAAATKDKMAVHPNVTEKPKSCREKFLQAWNEKLKLQPCPILYSQTVASQSAVDISVQEKQTRNKALSDLQTRASLQHNENAVYFVKVMSLSPEQMHPTPGAVCVGEHCPLQDAVASQHSNYDVTDKNVPSGSVTSVEEELLQICVSDLLMESPARKRPRLLPPHRKMHVEVWKKEASPPLQKHARNPVPLAYNHLVDTMSMTNLADLPEVESFYRRFNPKLKPSCDRKNSPIHSGAEGFLLARNTAVSTSQKAGGKTAKQHQQLSLNRSSPLPNLMVANIESMNFSQNVHLPPKKRYCHGCL